MLEIHLANFKKEKKNEWYFQEKILYMLALTIYFSTYSYEQIHCVLVCVCLCMAYKRDKGTN